MKVLKFLYEKNPESRSNRVLLVTNEGEKYVEGYELTDLPQSLVQDIENDSNSSDLYLSDFDRIAMDYDLNVFKRFLKSKIVFP